VLSAADPRNVEAAKTRTAAVQETEAEPVTVAEPLTTAAPADSFVQALKNAIVYALAGLQRDE
jgi:hypothetical protein